MHKLWNLLQANSICQNIRTGLAQVELDTASSFGRSPWKACGRMCHLKVSNWSTLSSLQRRTMTSGLAASIEKHSVRFLQRWPNGVLVVRARGAGRAKIPPLFLITLSNITKVFSFPLCIRQHRGWFTGRRSLAARFSWIVGYTSR